MTAVCITLAVMVYFHVSLLAILLLVMFVMYHLADIFYDKAAQVLIKMFKIELEDEMEMEERQEERKKPFSEEDIEMYCSIAFRDSEKPDLESTYLGNPSERLRRGLKKIKQMSYRLREDSLLKKLELVKDYPNPPRLEMSSDSSEERIPSDVIMGSDDGERLEASMMIRPRKKVNEVSIDEEDLGAPESEPFRLGTHLALDNQGAALTKKFTQDLDMMSIGDEEGGRNAPYNPLEWPTSGWGARFGYVFLFPVNLSYFFLFPNIADPVSRSKIGVMLFIVLACCFGNALCLAVFEYNFMAVSKGKVYIVSLVNAVVFVLP